MPKAKSKRVFSLFESEAEREERLTLMRQDPRYAEAASAQDAIHSLERRLDSIKVVSAEEVFFGTPDFVIQEGR